MSNNFHAAELHWDWECSFLFPAFVLLNGFLITGPQGEAYSYEVLHGDRETNH